MQFLYAAKEAILKADIVLFRSINTGMYNEYAEKAIKWMGNDIFVIIVLLSIVIFVMLKGKKEDGINIATALWALIFTNIIITNVLKPFFGRLRPAQELENIHMLVHMRSYNPSFPSTHTAMITVFAYVLWKDYSKLRPYLAAMVVLMGFLCIYTGGHYPLDVLAGFLSGLGIGWAADRIKILTQNLKFKTQKENS